MGIITRRIRLSGVGPGRGTDGCDVPSHGNPNRVGDGQRVRAPPGASNLETRNTNTHDSYIFQIKSADFAKTECRAHRVSPDGRLVSVGRTACDDGSVSFQLTFRPNIGDGGSMEIWHTGRGVAHYGHFAFNGEWFQWVSAQNVGSQENYYGPSNFTITNVSDRPL